MFSIKFTFLLEKESLSIDLNYSGSLEEMEIRFEKRQINDSQIEVISYRTDEIISRSIYKKENLIDSTF